MFDFLRDLRKPALDRRQERLNAYLDGALAPAAAHRLEEELAGDGALRAELESLRQVKATLSRLPQVRAPRHFTLDPAAYGKPDPAVSARAYPVLRTATALAAVFLVVLLSLQLPGLTLPQEVAVVQQEEAAAGAEVMTAQEPPRAAAPAEESLRLQSTATSEAHPALEAPAPLATELAGLPAGTPAAFEAAVEDSLEATSEGDVSQPQGEQALVEPLDPTLTVESEAVRLMNENVANAEATEAADVTRAKDVQPTAGLSPREYVTIVAALILFLLLALTLLARSRL